MRRDDWIVTRKQNNDKVWVLLRQWWEVPSSLGEEARAEEITWRGGINQAWGKGQPG